jgi:peptidoglycan/LPS O-acetylase OafA/YrhL
VDVLRAIGTALIFIQHALSLTDHDALSAVGGLRCGRMGTAIFFVIGGYLAAVSTRPPRAWLLQRLRTLLPAYWIVLALCFFGVWLTGYKSFDAWQVVCQFAGVGLFTHPDQLVNVTTWFVSALLVLYLVAYLARATSAAAVISLALVGMLAGGVCWPDSRTAWVWLGMLFLAGYSLPYFGLVRGAVGWTILLTIGAAIWPELRYGAAIVPLFAVACLWRQPWVPAQRVADFSYEWYLVHGPALHIAMRLTGGNFWPVLLVAALITLVGVVVLQQLVRYLEQVVWQVALVASASAPAPARSESVPAHAVQPPSV